VRVEQQPAFVLHARPWRETSLILEALTRDHGRVGLIARGVRRERARLPRALLQPLTPVRLDWSGRGELATLTAADAAGPMLPLAGTPLLCALYLNELVMRLVPRHDPHPELFGDYVIAIERLAGNEDPAWTLRRFERDLMGHLGYGMLLDADADSGEPVVPANVYAYRLDAGPVPWRGPADGLKLSGAALLALAEDRLPAQADLVALRRLMRALISHRLEGQTLRAWNMLGDGFNAPAPADS